MAGGLALEYPVPPLNVMLVTIPLPMTAVAVAVMPLAGAATTTLGATV